MSMSVLQPDARIGGRYRLGRLIAVGGMGMVWQADDEHLGRPVALKVLKPELACDETFRQRFRAEASHAGRLSHPSIATVYDYAETLDTSGATLAYLVMELVVGSPLRALLAARRLGVDETLGIVAQVGSALAAAHRNGIVHRDVKPANLLVRPDGLVKVTDFGIARAADSASLTQVGTVLGTVVYMSPEQRAGRTVGPPSDVYSLGLVTGECLSGVAPPPGGAGPAGDAAPATRWPRLPADTPSGVIALVSSMIDRDPDRRPSAREVANQARRLQRGGTHGRAARGSRQQRDPPPTEAQTIASTAMDPPTVVRTAPPVMPHARRRSRLPHRAVPVVLLVCVLGAVFAALFWALSPSSATSKVAVPSVVGDSQARAAARLHAVGLDPSERTADIAALPPGRVASQEPGPRTSVPTGSHVQLTVASGFVTIDAGSLVGHPVADAVASLSSLGLRVTQSTSETGAQTAGAVVAVDPSGRVPVGTTVSLVVAGAPPPANGGKGKGAAPAPAPSDHGSQGND
jgi:serine/threonine-protein kinase